MCPFVCVFGNSNRFIKNFCGVMYLRTQEGCVTTRHRWFLVLFGLAIVLVSVTMIAGSVAAQAISGDVVGTVLDKSGASVPNAAILAENVATGVKTSTTSNGPRRISLRQLAGRHLHHSGQRIRLLDFDLFRFPRRIK